MYGSSIPLNSKFSDIPTFPHGLFGVFISGDAQISRGVTIFQHVTIGSITTNGSKNVGAPIIGEGVIIGAGAKIIGNVKIGDNTKVGANCVVVNNIPEGATVVLSSPRVILNN